MTVTALRRERSELRRATEIADRFAANVETVVRGKPSEIRLVLTALACDGHVLFEDVPGTAKTVLARAIGQTIAGARASRIQGTPDLQPTDVTGLSIYNQKTRDFEFRPGPIFANVVLVDEINRAMPRTQSALLEAMSERQVTVDGITRALPEPFLLLATDNPIEHEGTFPLPEAQLDRFFLRTALGYPDPTDELAVIQSQRERHPLGELQPVVSLEEIVELKRAVTQVYADELIQRWIVGLVGATRQLDFVQLGASVRGSLALERAARAWALFNGREFVVPADVEVVFGPVLLHRIVVAPAFAAELRRDSLDAGALLWSRCLELAPAPETG
jgi:MoxR-like ATPase